ncbi:MAG: glycoside hydrolase family protein [Anaerolineae bacterium]|nr:glycoside hydrolase family protein [Anaerolineae bacterium]MCO5195480.1 glycoside hydrolase family protein [Anaerolineae bacterium]MCO5207627.1 glycoside hydrolase family protein [Anaerolineae bacterium]
MKKGDWIVLIIVLILAIILLIVDSVNAQSSGAFLPLVAHGGVQYGTAGEPRSEQDMQDFGRICQNWSPYQPDIDCDFVPLIETWYVNHEYTDGGYLIVLNEPDLLSQNGGAFGTDPALWPCAAADFTATVRDMYPNATLIGPNVSAWGVEFLHDFAACGGMEHIDIVGVHYYAWDADWQSMLTRVLDAAYSYGRPVWLTEYGVTIGNGGVTAANYADVHQAVNAEIERRGIDVALWFAPHGWSGGNTPAVNTYQALALYGSEGRQVTLAGCIQSHFSADGCEAVAP